MKIIVISDNCLWLNKLKNLGYITICSSGKSLTTITGEVKNHSGSADKIFIDISLRLDNLKERLDYAGIDLMEQLMFEIKVKNWNLLTFERLQTILKKNKTHIIISLSKVNTKDFINFLKEVSQNAK